MLEIPWDDARIHKRRAVGFLLLSAVFPGIVQRFAGNERVGRFALRVWVSLVSFVVLLLISVWLFPGPVVGLLLTPWLAATAKVVLWVVYFGWLGLLLDAWRLARPMAMARSTRLGMTIGVVLLAVALAFCNVYAASIFTAAANVGQVLPGGGDTEEKDGRYNILLLGVDAAADREGVRPDSINLVSVDARTGRTVVFGLPRNMQRVPFPKSSPMYKIYPKGFHCPDDGCMLNGIWTVAEDNANLFPKGTQPGLEATKAAVSETLGVEINYYAMVDMYGFSSIIDAMGGIKLDVMKRIPIGGVGAPVSGYIEPGREVLLDGYHALWFARSREGANDYERMQRQKCVLSAMAKQLDPKMVASRFVELSEAGKDLLRTDVPASELVTLAKLAMLGKSMQVASVNFSPPLIPQTGNPDFHLIRRTVQEYLTEAEKADEATATKASSSPVTAESTPATVASSKKEAGKKETASQPTESETKTADRPSAEPNGSADSSASETEVNSDEEAYSPEGAVADLDQVCSVS